MLMRLLDWVRRQLDPDRSWLSTATLQHYVGCFLTCAILDLCGTHAPFTKTMVIGTVYECGQWDAARGLPVCHEGEDLKRGFKPGYGFGLMDMAADAAGALTWVLGRAFGSAVIGWMI